MAAHGNFDRCSCIETGQPVPTAEVRAAIAHGRDGEEGWAAMAERHGGLVKPEIVFFGEPLPERFFALAEQDLAACDLLIILGTSLKVQPFASLVGLVRENVPRLLINRETVGTDAQPILQMLGFIDDRALDFDDETRYRDACFLGDCDDGVRQLAEQLDGAFAAAGPTDAAAGGDAPVRGWVESLRQRIDDHPPPPARPPLPAAARAAEADLASEAAAVAAAAVAEAVREVAVVPSPESSATMPPIGIDTELSISMAAEPAHTSLDPSVQSAADGGEAKSPEHKAARLSY